MNEQRNLWSLGMRDWAERLVITLRAVTLATALCVAVTTPAAPQGLLDFLTSIFPAQTFEQARTKTKQGYGAKVHGKIKIKGNSFDFVSGGRGRGSAPFGTYRVDRLSGFKAPKGTWVPGYHLSDAYDPYAKDTRRGLFIHPGHDASAGCVAIRKDEWPSFVKAMEGAAKGGCPVAIHLGPGSEPMQETPLPPSIEYAAHKRSFGRKRETIKAHLRSHSRTRLHRVVKRQLTRANKAG
jgi:hypothetical protein